MSAAFERIARRTVFAGHVISVHQDRYRYADGGEADREVVEHQGAVAIVAHDGTDLFLVRQPREATGTPDMLELPAGKLDVEGEPPAETAKRELAEEIGKAAAHWEHLHSFYTTVGFCNELVHVYLATDLSDVERPAVDEDERIDLVTHPLSDLDALLGSVVDSKTLIGLYALRRRWET